MKQHVVIATLLTVSLMNPRGAVAATLNVPNEHPDLESALQAALVGDIVEIAPGIYVENNLRVPAGITITGTGAGPGDVVIDAEGGGRILLLEGLEQLTSIRNITFKNGRASGDNSYDQSGGAIFCSNSQAELLNCDFIANEADSHGGAVRCSNSSPLIFNCNFSDNSAPAGGGGAIACSYGSSPMLQECMFSNNAAAWGGALSCRGGSSPTVDEGTFDSNTAAGSVALGGAVFADHEARLSFNKSTFCDNSASHGGALTALISSEAHLLNCTVAGNTALQDGGGLFLHNAISQITATLITFNEGSSIATSGSSQPQISCTDIYGNTLGDWIDGIEGQDSIHGNLSIDPQFCSRVPGDKGRFFLNEGSPAAQGGLDCELMGSKPVGCNLLSDAGPVPSYSGLGQVSVWPNPFNPRTSVEFEIEQAQHVRVSVFNLQGALVRILADREFDGGAQSIQWNGDDAAGRSIGSGIYIVVVEGRQDRQTRKITMLK